MVHTRTHTHVYTHAHGHMHRQMHTFTIFLLIEHTRETLICPDFIDRNKTESCSRFRQLSGHTAVMELPGSPKHRILSPGQH